MEGVTQFISALIGMLIYPILLFAYVAALTWTGQFAVASMFDTSLPFWGVFAGIIFWLGLLFPKLLMGSNK